MLGVESVMAVGSTTRALAAMGVRFHHTAERRLRELVGGSTQALVIFDVGANDGSWSRALLDDCRFGRAGTTARSSVSLIWNKRPL